MDRTNRAGLLLVLWVSVISPPALGGPEGQKEVFSRMVVAVEPEQMPDSEARWCKPGANKASDIALDDLPNETVAVTIRSTQRSGKVSYLVAGVARKGETYSVTQDYMKYCSVTYDDGGVTRYGIGLRVRADVVVKSADVNLNGLAALGFAASSNKLSGSITVEVVGISGRDVTNLLPMPTQLSQDSVINVIQAVATIKSKIYGDTSGPDAKGGAHITIQQIARTLIPEQIESSDAGTITVR